MVSIWMLGLDGPEPVGGCEVLKEQWAELKARWEGLEMRWKELEAKRKEVERLESKRSWNLGFRDRVREVVMGGLEMRWLRGDHAEAFQIQYVITRLCTIQSARSVSRIEIIVVSRLVIAIKYDGFIYDFVSNDSMHCTKLSTFTYPGCYRLSIHGNQRDRHPKLDHYSSQ